MVALLGRLVVVQHQVVRLRLHDPLPVDAPGLAEVIVVQDRHATVADLTERLETEGLEGGPDNVEGGEVFGEVSAFDDLQVAEGREVGEVGMVSLDVDEADPLP